MTASKLPADVIAAALEVEQDVDKKAVLARNLAAYAIGALAALEGAHRAADQVQAMVDRVRFT